MATKDDQSTSAPLKVSLVFGTKTKSGFVIPKNKLSGSLIPVFKPSFKNGSGKEEGKRAQRKTKWISDFTLDPSVRKTRALAYQTRLGQINKLLKGTTGEDTEEHTTGEYDVAGSPSKPSHADSQNKEMDKETQEQLELERREIIGEILSSNPSFKPPVDYKPLLKEAKVPIPIKEHPGCNFIYLLLGAESNIQKRLQDEIGAKMLVHGIMKGTGEKHEITQAEINEGQSAYEELHVDVYAETYKKLDSAISLLESLLAQATSSPVQASSSPTPTVLVDPKPTIQQFPSYPSPWAPPSPNAPLVFHSSPVLPRPSPDPSFQFNPYTGQSPLVTYRPQNYGPPPPPPPPHHHFPNSQSFHVPHGSGPHRPPYEMVQMHGGPPPPMYNMPPQPMHGPPIYPPIQATRMTTPNPPHPMRPPLPAPNNFTYQAHRPDTPSFRPIPQNPPNQFNFQTGPPIHHGFQYPRAQMDPFGYSPMPPHAGPGQVWNNSTRPDNSGMGRNFRPPLCLGRNNNNNYDPFSPTSGSSRPSKEDKVEADPEYEDLMASFGVK